MLLFLVHCKNIASSELKSPHLPAVQWTRNFQYCTQLRFEQYWKFLIHCTLSACVYLKTNNIHEKISPFWLVKSNAVVFFKQCRRANSVQKEVTNQAFWLVNDQRNSQMANQIFCFQIKRTPWMEQFFPDRVIRVRFFYLTISKFFHVYY